MKTVEALNAAFVADPNAIHALVANRVPCNQKLADDPYVVTDENPYIEQEEQYMVGAMGLVNAVLSANNLPLVASKWQHVEDGPNRFLGFCEYVPEPEPSEDVDVE